MRANTWVRPYDIFYTWGHPYDGHIVFAGDINIAPTEVFYMLNTIILSNNIEARSYFSRIANFAELGFDSPFVCQSFAELKNQLDVQHFDLAIVEEGFSGIPFLEIFSTLVDNAPLIEVIAISDSDSPLRERKALALGVCAYLHRPLASASFQMTLENAKSRLSRIKAIASDAYTQNTDSNSVKLYNDLLLKLLLTSPSSVPDIVNLCLSHGLDLLGNFHRVACFSAQSNVDSLALVQDFFIDTLKASYSCEPFAFQNSFAIVISSNTPLSDSIINILRELIAFAERSFETKLAFGISAEFSDLIDSFYAFKSASDMLLSPTVFSPTTKIDSAQLKFAKTFVDSVAKLDPALSLDQFEQAFLQLPTKLSLNLDQQGLALAYLSLVANGLNLSSTSTNLALGSFLSSVSSVVIGSEFRKKLCRFILDLASSYSTDNAKSAMNVAREALDYIKRNFYDPNISIKALSAHFHLTQNYMSALIKKQLGDSFVNILTRLRMEKAKELLLSTRKKVSAIASDVGFVDSHYFSYSFKKYYGMSPLDMRK